MASDTDNSSARSGVISAGTAFLVWGLVPFYWKGLQGINAVELIAHRIAWSLLFLIPIVIYRGSWKDFVVALRSPRTAGIHLVSGTLLSVNWLVYVWAVNENMIVETALGYFLTPLVNVALGIIILRERMRAAQGLALALACAGVAILIVGFGQLPWVSLVLAGTFGSYGLLRKRSTLGSLAGLTLETTLLLPIAMAFLLWRHTEGVGALENTGSLQTFLILFCGVLTAVPLLLFAHGARRIHLATVGLLQFIAPSVQFVIGVYVYSEPLPPERLWAFGFIWTALLLYSVDSIRTVRRRQ